MKFPRARFGIGQQIIDEAFDAKRWQVFEFLGRKGASFGPYIIKPPSASQARIYQGLQNMRNRSSLGDLHRLPYEILIAIVKMCTYKDVENIRVLNSAARNLVNSFWPYEAIRGGAPGLLWALEKTGLSSKFTLNALCRTFGSQSCEICGRFGDFCFLPTLTRCCHTCGLYNPELQPMTIYDAWATFKCPLHIMSTLPQMTSIRGEYSGVLGSRPQPHIGGVLIGKRWAREVGTPETVVTTTQRDIERRRRCASLVKLFHQDLKTRRGTDGWLCQGCIALRNECTSTGHACRTIVSSEYFTPEELTNIGNGGGGSPCEELALRRYNDEDFFNHVLDCYGARIWLKHQLLLESRTNRRRMRRT